jgi:hypothetical protein
MGHSRRANLPLHRKTLSENSGFFHRSFRTCDLLAVRNLADTWVKSKADLLLKPGSRRASSQGAFVAKLGRLQVNTLVALCRPVQIDDDFKVTLLFSLGGLMLSLALLSVNPEAPGVLGAY